MVQFLEVAECHVESFKISLLLLSHSVQLHEAILGGTPLQRLVLILGKVVVILEHTLVYRFVVFQGVFFHDSSLKLVIDARKVLILAPNVILQLIILQRLQEALCRLIEGNFFILFVDERSDFPHVIVLFDA